MYDALTNLSISLTLIVGKDQDEQATNALPD